jgi:hypothetical protein
MGAKLINKTNSKNDKKVVYKIEKDFSLINIEQIKVELDTLLTKHDSLHLELKNLDSFDLSSIQLLHALKTKMGDNLSYSLEVKDEIKTIIQHSGFDYLLNM